MTTCHLNLASIRNLQVFLIDLSKEALHIEGQADLLKEIIKDRATFGDTFLSGTSILATLWKDKIGGLAPSPKNLKNKIDYMFNTALTLCEVLF